MTRSSDPENTRQLHKAYAAKSRQEVSGCYDSWAEDYETHMKNVGYLHPAMVAALLTRHVPAGSGPILDAGAGTGIMAEILVALGYPEVVGFDGSKRMLEAAAGKKAYVELRQMYLGAALDYPDDRFAAVVSAGVFTQGHAPLSGLDELVRITRAGGHIIFSAGPAYLDGPLQQKREELESKGLWRFVDASERYNSTPLEETLPAQVFVFTAT
jgi:predicted TPR repeat methyltransferase